MNHLGASGNRTPGSSLPLLGSVYVQSGGWRYWLLLSILRYLYQYHMYKLVHVEEIKRPVSEYNYKYKLSLYTSSLCCNLLGSPVTSIFHLVHIFRDVGMLLYHHQFNLPSLSHISKYIIIRGQF